MSIDLLARKIRRLEIQSNTTVAIKSLKALRVLARKGGFGKDFWKAASKLEKARPTEIALFNCLEILRKNPLIITIDALLHYFPAANERLSRNGSKLFQFKKTVLAHCHSTNVVKLLLKNKRKVSRVFVTETRPLYQGRRTAKELVRGKIKVVFIVDSAAGLVLPETDLVLLGADAIGYPGVFNKVGSFNIALAAKRTKTKFYIVSNLMKLDFNGKAQLEERPVIEVGDVKGASILNPAFDIIPWDLITGVVTEQGILTKKQVFKRLSKGIECISI